MIFDNLTSGSSGYFSWLSSGNCFKIDGTECTLTKFMVDADSAKTGWGKLGEGVAPHYVWAEIAGTRIPKPGDDYKVAISVDVYVSTKFGAPVDGWRPWSTTASASREALREIWHEVDAGAKANPGKHAVIEVTGSVVKDFGKAKVRMPTLKVVGWAPAPEDKAAPVEAAPPPPPAPALAATDEDLF